VVLSFELCEVFGHERCVVYNICKCSFTSSKCFLVFPLVASPQPCNIYNTSYGQKKGWESNCQFDSWPLKVKIWPNFLAFRQHATYCWKAFDKGYNFASDLIVIRGLHKKLWAFKVAGVQDVGISGLPLGNPGIKIHLDVAPWRSAKYTIRGKVLASPKFGPWWVLCVWVARGSS
jgi:hypothetical protein